MLQREPPASETAYSIQLLPVQALPKLIQRSTTWTFKVLTSSLQSKTPSYRAASTLMSTTPNHLTSGLKRGDVQTSRGVSQKYRARNLFKQAGQWWSGESLKSACQRSYQGVDSMCETIHVDSLLWRIVLTISLEPLVNLTFPVCQKSDDSVYICCCLKWWCA